VQLPPPPEARAALEAARGAALAELARQHPHLGEGALLAYYTEGLRRAGALRHDGARARGYRPPPFLRGYPVPPGFAFNYNSFMGGLDPLKGKYYVPCALVPTFLREMHGAMRRGYKLCMSENYHRRPYRWRGGPGRGGGWDLAGCSGEGCVLAHADSGCSHPKPPPGWAAASPLRHFQELDFDWSLPIDLVLKMIPCMAAIAAEEAAATHGLAVAPEPIISMRTPYKVQTAARGTARCGTARTAACVLAAARRLAGCSACLLPVPSPFLWAPKADTRTLQSPHPCQVHLNFPTIVTTESRARRARKAVINRCRAELAGLPPLALLKEEVAAAVALERAEREFRELEAEEARLLQLKAAGGAGRGGGEGSGADREGGAAEGGAERGAAAAGGAIAEAGGAESGSGSGSGSGDRGRGGAEAGAVAAGEALHPLLAALDWEAVVDVPHGSLRLPGCYKAPWMDKDPAWVEDKCYSIVEW
jgi:hypothetical protein